MGSHETLFGQGDLKEWKKGRQINRESDFPALNKKTAGAFHRKPLDFSVRFFPCAVDARPRLPLVIDLAGYIL